MSNTKTLKTNINQDKLRSFAQELAKDVKTQADLADLSSTLLKMTVEAALGAEMEYHLGYPKHEQGGASGNARNGYGTKTLKGDHGEIELSIPRDRNRAQ